MRKLISSSLMVVASASMVTTASASLIFDDFNVDEGHFGFSPSFSPTSVGEDATSTADRVTTTSFEGIGSQRLTLVHDATATPLRIRHVSGGPPYNSSTAGLPVGNTGYSFTTGAGTDGWIGFYAKTTATGWQTSINLDGSGNTTAEMDGSASVALISDGQWHLYEWNLDAAGWGSVPGIGGGHAGGLVANGSHTIDSIYFRDLDGTTGPTADIYIDFVAWNPNGTIADLVVVPEPSSLVLGALGGVGALLMVRRKKN